jgi:phospholipid/cholesterol/gamma-HCH transport system permease protein
MLAGEVEMVLEDVGHGHELDIWAGTDALLGGAPASAAARAAAANEADADHIAARRMNVGQPGKTGAGRRYRGSLQKNATRRCAGSRSWVGLGQVWVSFVREGTIAIILTDPFTNRLIFFPRIVVAAADKRIRDNPYPGRELAMASAHLTAGRWINALGAAVYQMIADLGDLTIFTGRTLSWMLRRRPPRGTMTPILHYVGVRSVPVVAITGSFIGMVLAVQSYRDFNNLGLATRLGSIINISIVRELGPVLAATMIAGRVGSAMAAELGTMRITEQIEALLCLGANAIHYLVVPRLLACVLLIPLLTVVADFAGVMGGAFICVQVYHVDAHFYWERAEAYVRFSDVLNGLIKATVFGAAIGLISCQRGFNCRAGAEGVGRAATEAFVASFIAILVLDFFLAMFLSNLTNFLWPGAGHSLL